MGPRSPGTKLMNPPTPPAAKTTVTKPPAATHPAPKEDPPTLQDQKIKLLLALLEEKTSIKYVNWDKVAARLTNSGKTPKTQTVKARCRIWFPDLYPVAPQKVTATVEAEDRVEFYDIDLGNDDVDDEGVGISWSFVYSSLGGNVLLRPSTRDEEPEMKALCQKERNDEKKLSYRSQARGGRGSFETS